MIFLVASFTKRHKVIGCIPTGLPRLYVMHVENGITRLSLAALAFMSIPEQYVLPYVPETKLFSLLVISTLRNGQAMF